MWYKINWGVIVIQQLLPKLRKPMPALFGQIFINPIASLYDKWSNWRLDNLYKIEHSGQVCYLRKSLNDKFDPSLRRIFIGDGQVYKTTYIYTEAEEQNVFINQEFENNTLWIRSDEETADTGFDFIVFVPQEIYNSQIHALHAHIKFYKVGGKRYSIFIRNE